MELDQWVRDQEPVVVWGSVPPQMTPAAKIPGLGQISPTVWDAICGIPPLGACLDAAVEVDAIPGNQ